jgi:hypothetical protein
MNTSEDGAYVFRDKEDNKLTLFMYTKEDSRYNTIFFRNKMTYTAITSLEGLTEFMTQENPHCMHTHSFEELRDILNITENDYNNLLNVINSKIDITPISTGSASLETTEITEISEN